MKAAALIKAGALMMVSDNLSLNTIETNTHQLLPPFYFSVYIDNELIPSDFISDDKQGKQLKDTHAASLKEDSRHTYGNRKNSSPISTLSLIATDAGHRLGVEARKLKKVKKKYRKFLFPLLLAYKLKFFTLIPVLISGLILLVASTGLAGFFFALFTAVMSLKGAAGKAVVVQEY
uniref:Uncharacterized protein n=1 Tax=Glossina morsitans morsitans TaxID=37546 RepID=A0A1B0FJ18_GLOMM